MPENKLKTILAAPIPLTVSLGDKEETIFFNRLSIGMRVHFANRWGEKVLEEGIKNCNLDIIIPMLYALLVKGQEEKLLEIGSGMGGVDENGNEITISQTPFESLKNLISYDWETLNNLLLEICGIDHEAYNKLDNKKKEALNELMNQTEKLTSQESSQK